LHIGNGSKPADWEQLNQIEIENELNWICDSRQYACKATFDNTQNIFYGMTQEADCAKTGPIYTWWDATGIPVSKICFQLTDCQYKDMDCVGCHSDSLE